MTSDICWDVTLEAVILAVENLKEACADEEESIESVTGKTVHRIHQGTYLEILAALEQLRKDNQVPEGGVRAERIQLWLLNQARKHIEAVPQEDMPRWFGDAPRGSYLQLIAWLIEQVNSGILVRNQFASDKPKNSLRSS